MKVAVKNRPCEQALTKFQSYFFSDTQGPRIQITNRVPPQTSNPRTKIAWVANEPGTFKCVLDGVEVPCGDGTSGQYTTPELPDGKHSFSVSSVDSLGNKGRPLNVNWETGK